MNLIKVCLDTTYLMPLFGLDTSIKNLKPQFLELLEKNRYLFHYSPVSIIEIKWQIINLSTSRQKAEKFETQFSQALTALKADKRFVVVDFLEARINDFSFELRKLGHTDYFDTVIAGSAVWETKKFVTEDEPLKQVIQQYFQTTVNSGLNEIEIISWDEFYSIG